MSLKSTLTAVALAVGLGGTGIASASVTVVPGTSDPWLAGMPAGSTASSTDSAPGQSPVLLTGVPLMPGSWLTFAVTGSVGNCPGCNSPTPDGGGIYGHDAGAENGIANVLAPINGLLGVFLDGTQPSLTPEPAALNFAALGTGFASLTPGLKQVFFIGDGVGDGGVTQKFFVPTGATRLYLGTMDGYEWINNVGAYNVSVSAVPEPETYAMLLAGLGMLGFIARHRKAS